MHYKDQRRVDFNTIKTALKDDIHSSSSCALVVEGDSLGLLKKIPSNSVSLILTDPPYHATKKKNIYGDTLFEKDQCYLNWMAEYAKEWRRVLKPNGSLFCYCDSSMSARLEVLFSHEFNILSHVVWTKPNEPGFDGWKGKMKKESLRQWYGHSERIIFAEPALEGNLHRSPFAQFLREKRKLSGLSGHKLTEMVGAYGKVNHGGAVSNWEAGRNTPSREQYEKISTAILSTGKVKSMPPYEDVIRPFIMDGTKEFTDVWNFPSVRPYKGKHPAEKPLDMLKHAIEATTHSGDIVLDCFGGSGSTMLASLESERLTLSIEIEEKWVDSISSRLNTYCDLNNHEFNIHKTREIDTNETMDLFEQQQKEVVA
ncbi:site-specific DNA-methyltransferase [Vibrio cyclitrophicus]|uniref:site-specific DNA-methyltransferase n=1 Tax=Vibrio cyclitrophicus TaxID=47951 RepID=UPI0002F52BA6|nr:site-specific DNA-methyltransferase [Vibrio cyclitrophicus]NOH20091.1 site-specific DNA-methyltransferase [Vibrio cyclitrophicus]